MKGLSIHQPYALLIAVGAKMVETRGWSTGYRGPVLIHCSRQWDELTAAQCRWAMEQLVESQFDWTDAFPGWRECCGHVLALAELIDCCKMTVPPPGLEGRFGTYGRGRWGLVFDHVEPILPPIRWRGMQKLWDAPSDLRAVVREQVGRRAD